MIEDAPRKEKLKWYYKGWAIILAILCFGPLGLFPLWFRPRTNIWIKVGVSVVVMFLTVLFIQQTVVVYQMVLEYYKELGKLLAE